MLRQNPFFGDILSAQKTIWKIILSQKYHLSEDPSLPKFQQFSWFFYYLHILNPILSNPYIYDCEMLNGYDFFSPKDSLFSFSPSGSIFCVSRRSIYLPKSKVTTTPRWDVSPRSDQEAVAEIYYQRITFNIWNRFTSYYALVLTQSYCVNAL